MSRLINLNKNNKFPHIIILISFVVIILIITIFLVAFKNDFFSESSRKVEVDKSIKNDTESTEKNAKENTANEYLVNNNPDSAIKVFQQSIDVSKSNEEKADSLIRRAALLYDYDPVEYKDQIIADAYKAEELYPTPRSATFIYDMESRYGNKEKADKYLAIIYERTKNDSEEVE